MKKIILWSLLTFSLFSLVQDVGAVTFGSTGATMQFPAIRGLDFGLISNSVLDGRNPGNAGPVFFGSTSDFQRYTTLGCFVFNSTSSGLIYTAGTTILFDGYSHQQTGLNFYMTDTASGKLVTFKTFIPGYDDTNIPRQFTDNIMLVPLVPNSGGDYPSLGVICLAPTFTHVLSTNNMYLFGIKFSYYNGSTGNFGYDEFRYLTPSAYGTLFMNFDLDIHPFASKGWGGQTVGYFPYASSNGSGYTYAPYQSTQLLENEFVDFLSGTGQYTNRTLPMFFQSKSKITGQFVTGISGSGTNSSTGSIGGSTNYYASCGSFLDVGCYIKATYDSAVSVFPTITGTGGWFDVTYAIPVSSSGLTNTSCTVIDENLHYQDTTNQNSIHYASSLPPVQYVFDIANSIVGLFAVTMKSFVPSPTVCLFGITSVVPTHPRFQDIGLSPSLLASNYNNRFGGVSGDLHTGSIQSFFDLFFVFIFTISVLMLIRPIFVIEL